MYKTDGKFIVIEGIDGSGTTTQSELLNEYLLKEGFLSKKTSEPTNGYTGKLIRELLKDNTKFSGTHYDRQFAYLAAADRHEHLYNLNDGIIKENNEGKHVISTRYLFSSLAYNASNNKEYLFVKELNKRFPLPDLTIYINNPVELSLERINKRDFKEVYETREHLTLIKSRYDKIFNDFKNRRIIIDGTLSIEEQHIIIREAVLKTFLTKKEIKDVKINR